MNNTVLGSIILLYCTGFYGVVANYRVRLQHYCQVSTYDYFRGTLLSYTGNIYERLLTMFVHLYSCPAIGPIVYVTDDHSVVYVHSIDLMFTAIRSKIIRTKFSNSFLNSSERDVYRVDFCEHCAFAVQPMNVVIPQKQGVSRLIYSVCAWIKYK